MTRPFADSPYRGLAPYSEEDAPLFFGRENQKRLVVDNLTSQALTILYGPSGVGKTSFLYAGVLRHLRELAQQRVGAGEPPELAALVFRSWREEPVASLQAAVGAAVEETLGGRPTSSPPDGLAETCSWAAQTVRGFLYVILDQFEDYFLYWDHDHGPGSFSDEFPRAVNSAKGRVRFLVSLREDALAKMDRFKRRIPSLFANYLRLDHLDREQGREAIERPLEVFNAMQSDTPALVEPDLSEAVLEAVESGKIPGVASAGNGGPRRVETAFLQLVLSRVWQEEVARGSKVLRRQTLEELGGAVYIVRDSVVSGIAVLDEDQQELAHEALRFLITASGARVAFSAQDLAAYVSRSESEVANVLERLARGDVRIIRATPGAHGETVYEVFSDLLVAPLNEWRIRRSEARAAWEARQAAEEARQRETEVRRLRIAVAVLAVLAGVLLVVLIVSVSS